jgi:hypothetical protein
MEIFLIFYKLILSINSIDCLCGVRVQGRSGFEEHSNEENDKQVYLKKESNSLSLFFKDNPGFGVHPFKRVYL